MASPGFSSDFATKSIMGENVPCENFWGFRLAKKNCLGFWIFEIFLANRCIRVRLSGLQRDSPPCRETAGPFKMPLLIVTVRSHWRGSQQKLSRLLWVTYQPEMKKKGHPK